VAAPRPVTGASAHDLEGVTPGGDPVVVAVTNVEHDTVLAFLSSGCTTCATFWDAFRDQDSLGLSPGTRLVVVTKGPEDESQSRVLALAPSSATVVMSSAAWDDYEAPVVPYFVDVDGGSGRQRGSGTSSDWAQILALMGQAVGDADLARHRVSKAAADAEREARADRELLRAGIRPGDPTLYPGGSRQGQ
jgi:hypothetical protein